MSMTPPTSLMDTGSVPSWSYKDKPVGTVYSGTVVSTEWRQQTDYDDPTKLMWWNPNSKKPQAFKAADNSKPVWQYVITLDTDERTSPEDDGRRRCYVQMGQHGTDLLRQAVRDAGLPELVAGAGLKEKFTDVIPATDPKFNDRKVKAYKVTAPVAPAASLDEFDGPAPATAPPVEAF